MSAEQLDHDTRERQRLLALLALTSQELPRAPRDSRNLHDYLDADVEAFETVIAQHRANKAAQWRTRTRLAMRLAASLAAVAVLTAVVLAMLPSREASLQAALDRSYSQLANRARVTAAVEPSSPSAQAPGQLGFSSAQRASVASKSFAAGVADGEARLARSRLGQREREGSYYILGQWNVLLAAAARSEQPVSFWLAQREFGRQLVRELSAAGDVNQQAVSHLQKLDAMLAVLAAQGRSGRIEYELAKELQLFRAYLAPDIEQTR